MIDYSKNLKRYVLYQVSHNASDGYCIVDAKLDMTILLEDDLEFARQVDAMIQAGAQIKLADGTPTLTVRDHFDVVEGG